MAQHGSAEGAGNLSTLILDDDPFDAKHYVHNIMGIFADRLYILNSEPIDIRCEFCCSFSTNMCAAACGHNYCMSCIYEDLASLGIAKCPVCFVDNLINRERNKSAAIRSNSTGKPSLKQELESSKQILQHYTTYFSQEFDPSMQSIYMEGMGNVSLKGYSMRCTAEIFPIHGYTVSVSQSKDIQNSLYEPVEILCRFHKDISPLLSECRSKFHFTEDGLQRYHDHMLHCYKTNILYKQHQQLEANHLKHIKQRLTQRFNEKITEYTPAKPAELDSPEPVPDPHPHPEPEPDLDPDGDTPNKNTNNLGHIISNNTMLMGNAIPASPISSEFLPYSMSFYSAECKRLFKADTDSAYSEKYSFQKEIFRVPPNRNPVVGHIILKRLVYDVLEHEQFLLQRDFWNCQVIFFINPYETINYFLFSNITLGLQVEAPDGRSSTYEFVVDRENFQEHPILRFYLRVLTFYEGRYSFTLKWSCSLPNAQTGGYTIFQSGEQISTFVAKPILGPNLSPICLKSYIDSAPPIHPKLLGLLTLGHEVLTRGHECISQIAPDDTSSPVVPSDLSKSLPTLGLKEIEALYLYAAYSHTVKDGCFFCVGCKAYAYVKESATLMNTAPFLHALILILDRYPEVEIIQTPAIDLILALGTTLPNFFSSTSIVGNSLLGRLRRIKHIFKNLTKPLKDTIYMISQRAYHVLPTQLSTVFEDFSKANELTRLYINREILNKIPCCSSFSMLDMVRFYLAALRLLRDSDPGKIAFEISGISRLVIHLSRDSPLFKIDPKSAITEKDMYSFYLNERARLTPTPNTWREYVMLHIVGYLCGIWDASKDTLQTFYKALFEIIINNRASNGDFITAPSFTKLHEKLLALLPGKILDIDNPYNDKNIAIIKANVEFLTKEESASRTPRTTSTETSHATV
ncbi:hypothetical protein GL50803_0095254 [Giardia duodenalis]|uniref:Uncharacterized protein n=1 Tax=Giardia intestinalis (strain ATCC 50803 / WB clone C6) TaxID=184922 RepID=A8BB92_GIAIC|nr:hypothetical protein GL50803_0095254 [Giardia intestinalis]KAE8302056.1 hypothetical protein GL50803_0095254 [Giardia intestinalis]|eukprot:XP_001708237.1 Hypothetical protein GL50803_95254 [Giardia lamblia ATCC 50803]